MWFAHARDPMAPGRIIRVYAGSLSEEERYSSEFICPLCGEQTFYVQKVGDPKKKGFRPSHFKHQKRSLCDKDECELRIDGREPGTYISQRIRTPLFLRPGPDGKFTLSAGFSSANKDLLRKLWDKSYRTIQIHSRKGLQGSASIESLLKNGEMGFIDLSEPIIKQSHAKLVAVTEEGTFSQASLLNKAWEETLDWFGNPACTGALFECGAGTSGQKVLAGDCVEAGKEYLLAIKDTGWTGKTILERTLSSMERVGYLSFPKLSTYTVYKVRLPDSKSMEREDYDALTTYMQERIGVLLCDTKPGFEPLWPPAAKKSNAYLVGKTGESKYALVSVEGLAPEDTICIHRTTESSIECLRGTAGLLEIASIPLTIQLQPVSSGFELEDSPQSYRLTSLQSILVPVFYAQQVNSTKIWNARENCVLTLPENYDGYDLRSNCGFTLYGSGCDMHVTAGEKYRLIPSEKEYLVITDAGQLVILGTTPSNGIAANSPSSCKYGAKYEKYPRKYGGKYIGKYA